MTREKAIEIIENIPALRREINIAHSVHGDLANALYMAILALKQPEVRHGKWIVGEMDVFGAPIHCSECGWGSNRADQNKWMKYQGHRCCGSCGAIMDEEE